jgi:hypothetical protein
MYGARFATDPAPRRRPVRVRSVPVVVPRWYTLTVPRGNPSPKLAITVDPDVHAEVIEAAAAEGVSVSAWMTAAARRALRVRSGLAAVAEWEADNGPLTGEELDAARHRAGLTAAHRTA